LKTLRILGTRGVPAAHGGFETFAQYLSLYLVKRGWKVVVYCQKVGNAATFEDTWQGVTRVNIAIASEGPKGTMLFDWLATKHASQFSDLCITLGYNTAVFCALLRLKGIPNLINMDGIEWSRAKWGPAAKLWFWLNDWAGCWLGNHLIADHPQIKKHLETRVNEKKITTIPYGADAVTDVATTVLFDFDLLPRKFMTVIARPEPENSLLQIVHGFSQKKRGVSLVVLGNYDNSNDFHRAVKEAASDEVKFVGAIYDKHIVQALRFHSVAYIHGHQVGGTNPSLIEALGAGNAVIAHGNRFNRWVLGESAVYFETANDLSQNLDQLLDNAERLEQMRLLGTARFNQLFQWETVLGQYEKTLTKFLPKGH
jgi:glycosyltransferase involved in cell wall biosynthesis